MNVILPVILVFVLLSLGAGLIIWYAFRKQSKYKQSPVSIESQTSKEADSHFNFQWRYITAPLVILIVSIIIVVYYYRFLPDELAYHFTTDGSGDRWLSREWFTVIILLVQFLLASVGAGIALIVAKMGQWSVKAGTLQARALPGVIAVMSNMVVLPQLVLGFTMLETFSYNAYQVHLLSPYTFTLIVLLVGGLVLAFLFFKAIKQFKAIK